MNALLVSLHDVTPHYRREIDRIVAMLDRIGLLSKTTLLLVPHFHHRARLDVDHEFNASVRAWAARGAELTLHGYYHLDETRHVNPLTSLKARHLTNREGEFVGLGRVEARRRIEDGIAMIQSCHGVEPRGFVAPAWLYSREAMQAVSEAGFDWAEDRFGIRDFARHRTLARGLAITFRVRNGVPDPKSIPWAHIAPRVLACSSAIRWAIHPADAASDSLMQVQESALEALAERRNAMTYSDFVALHTR